MMIFRKNALIQEEMMARGRFQKKKAPMKSVRKELMVRDQEKVLMVEKKDRSLNVQTVNMKALRHAEILTMLKSVPTQKEMKVTGRAEIQKMEKESLL